MPLTDVAMSSPSRSSSWVRSTAYSSGVRVGDGREPPVVGEARGAVGSRSVPMPNPTPSLGDRHRLGAVARVQADHRLGVAHVDGEQHAQPSPPARRPPSVQIRSRPRSSTGAEWVSAPTEMVPARRRRSADGGQGHAPGHLDQDPGPAVHPCDGDRTRRPAPGPCCRAAPRRRRRGRLCHLLQAVALDLDHPPRPQRPGPAHRLGDARPGEVVVLDQDGVGEAGPVVGAATGAHRRLLEGAEPRAWSCGCRGPAPRVALVRGRHEARGQRGDARRWPRKFSAVRSAVRIGRSGPVISMTVSPVDTSAVGRCHTRVTRGRPGEGLLAQPARRRRRCGAPAARSGRSRPAGHQRGRQVPSGPRSSARARPTASATARA